MKFDLLQRTYKPFGYCWNVMILIDNVTNKTYHLLLQFIIIYYGFPKDLNKVEIYLLFKFKTKTFSVT